jgi:ubiquinone/menaquinone biosynthesis C-methylase UbiE
VTTFKDLERDGWNARSSVYASFAGRMTGKAAPSILDAVRARGPMRLLDVCTGPGYVAAGAVERGCSAVGVDIAAGMIDEARRRVSGAEFHVGDAEALAFPDASFDAVTSAFGMLHLAEPEKAIAEAFRVLRPGGRYAWTVWCGPERAQLSGIAQEAMSAHADLTVPMPPAPPRELFSSEENARAALERAGFVEVVSEELPLTFHADGIDAVWEWFDKGTVRTAALLHRQTAPVQARIKEAILAGAARFVSGGKLTIPNHAIMHSARKP